MRSSTGRHLLCLLLLFFPLSWAEDTKKDARKTENVLSLFQHATLSPSLPFQRHKSHILAPARRCGRLMENCSSHLPCCDPCASCRCRLFNTICHCWRMNPLCLKRT
uniref:Agouti signaling protein, nonagouti homolog (mouse) 2b n=1 Tax=Xiphophorus couchianus TaxID=32473 RepID=A0A3B5LC29_9TELE